jgi:hypothetical protein
LDRVGGAFPQQERLHAARLQNGVGRSTGNNAIAAAITGSCSPTKVKFIASEGIFQIDSTSFQTAPESTLAFVQGGAQPSCVIVSVSAQPIASGGSALTIRLTLDGNAQIALPNTVVLSDGGDGGNQTRSFDFIFPSVEPGRHTLRLQAKTSDALEFTDLNRHNIIIQFAP